MSKDLRLNRDYMHNLVVYMIKLLLISTFVFRLGILKGLISALIFMKIYYLFISKLYNLEPFASEDLNFISWEQERQYNISLSLVIEGHIKKKFIENFIEKGIRHFLKLRQKPIVILGDFYWKNCSENESVNRIIELDEKLNTEDDIKKFSNNLIDKPFNIGEIQYRLYISVNYLNQTVVVLQFDHSLCDGIGLICLLMKISNDFDIKKFPQLKKKSVFEKILNTVLIPFYSFYAIYRLLIDYIPTGPFKTIEYSTNKELIYSDRIPFQIIRAIAKKNNISFNDYMLNIITNSVKKYCRENNYSNIDSFTCLIPINFRETPNCENELVLTNESSGAPIKIKFIDDEKEQINQIKLIGSKYIRKHLLSETTNFLNKLSNYYLPSLLSRFMIKLSAKNFDFVISNVAGPSEPLLICNSKVSNILCNPGPGPHSCFIAIFTYMNELRLFYSQDKSVKCKGDIFVQYIQNEINESINSFKSN